MNKKLMIASMLSLAFLISCGSDSDDSDGNRQEQTEKNLFSRWEDENGVFLNFTNASFNQPFEFSFFFQNGEVCSCTLIISGDQNAGDLDLIACNYAGGGSGDPGCANLNGSYDYTKDSSTLTICGSTCTDYR